MRLIDADELKKCAIPCEIHNGSLTDLCVPLYHIDNAPTVEIGEDGIDIEKYSDRLYKIAYEKGKAERPQGEWINREAVSNTTFPFWERYECNQCHKFNGYSNFCPNCGADMRGKNEKRE